MRHFKYILSLLVGLSSLLMLGCSKEEGDMLASSSESQFATLSVDIVSGSPKSRAVSSLEEDFTIKTLRILAIDERGDVEANVYVDDVTTSSATSSVLYTLDVIRAPRKVLYVVVNEPTTLTDELDGIKHQYQLLTFNYEVAEALNNNLFIAGESLSATNKLIPMSAIAEVNAKNDCKVVIKVDRVVARVDFMVDKDVKAQGSNVQFDSSTSVSVTGLYYDTNIFPTTTLPTPTRLVNVDGVQLSKTTTVDLKNDSRSSAKRLFSFYMAERKYALRDPNRIAINIDKVKVDGVVKNINRVIILGDNVTPAIEEIKRNHVYRIYATYNGTTITPSGDYVIMDWNVEELDGDIEGVMLAVTNQVVMDWTRLKNSFTANDVAFGSNRPIELSIPTAYDEATGKYTFAKCNFVMQSGAEYDLRDMSIYGISDAENYLLKIPWLTEARVVFESDRTGHFVFTYQLGTTPDHLDSVPLQIVSANVRKNLEILYDNGYVPGTLLQANDVNKCWGDAPNGIIFAKRGDTLNPIVANEVIYKDGEFYEGDIKKLAAEADAYCKSKLGYEWYVPNKAQLADIQRHVLELGVSYRFNNGADTLYWSSEIDGANYWAVDFSKGAAEATAVSTPATTLCNIRCISNL